MTRRSFFYCEQWLRAPEPVIYIGFKPVNKGFVKNVHEIKRLNLGNIAAMQSVFLVI